MCNDKHLRVLKRRAEHVLNCRIGCVIKVRRALVHDEERRRPQLEQAPSEREQLSLSLAWKANCFGRARKRIMSATLNHIR